MSDSQSAATITGAQTLERGLSVLEAVGAGHHDLEGLVRATGLSRSTVHRLLQALVQRRYLRSSVAQGYELGPKLLELGSLSQRQLHLPSLARPFLEALARRTGDTVHLGVLDGRDIIYIDKVSGSRGVETTSYIGARKAAQNTGLGKALIAQLPPERWPGFYTEGERPMPNSARDLVEFQRRLRDIERQGHALDMEENERGIHCVAAPVFDGSGSCVAAVSVTSAALFMPPERMQELVPVVREACAALSRELGWSGNA